MTLLVPFDGSPLAEAALSRAEQFAELFDESVLVVTVVPTGNTSYARERGWIDAGDPFDLEAIVDRLGGQVADRSPDATFRHERAPRDARTGTIAKRVRAVAREVEPSMVIVGSENAGRLVASLSSVGSNVASDPGYDVVIVRHTGPPPVETAASVARAE